MFSIWLMLSILFAGEESQQKNLMDKELNYPFIDRAP